MSSERGTSAVRACLPIKNKQDGARQDSDSKQIRWHFQDGPIDLIIDVCGSASACDTAIEAAWQRFTFVLPELCAQLPLLRCDGTRPEQLVSPIAQRMAQACWPFHANFGLYVTPMAAVAGSVAQEMLAFFKRPGIGRASVNNGGDIALFVGDGAPFRIGVVGRPDVSTVQGLPELDSVFEVGARDGLEGVASSGWRGRSLSLGIADAVTVLAKTAAQADAAATLLANAVNVHDAAIVRCPANLVRDDSDLHDRLVTRGVPPLPRAKINDALDSGAEFAQQLLDQDLIASAYLLLQGQARVVQVRDVQVRVTRLPEICSQSPLEPQ